MTGLEARVEAWRNVSVAWAHLEMWVSVDAPGWVPQKANRKTPDFDDAKVSMSLLKYGDTDQNQAFGNVNVSPLPARRALCPPHTCPS